MSANSGVNFKAYLAVTGEETQVKRFFVDMDAVTSFVFIKEKLKNVFPILHGTDFKITWKDVDGDHILISNDEDLVIALTGMQDPTRILYVTADPLNNFSDPADFVPKVLCNVCNKHVTGYRYKCLECPDYDLCATCENSGNHSEHIVIRLANGNIPFARVDRKMFHHAARALKKSACAVAKEAHRFTRESFRGEKHQKTEPSTSTEKPQGCPFANGEPLKDIVQNLNPLIEMFTRGVSTNNNEATSNPIADIVKSFMDAMNAGAEAKAPEPEPEKPASTTSEAKSTQEPPKEANQDMEWTILNQDQGSKTPSVSSVASAPTQTPTPPQDTRLMRGLAQLHDMGFSNENNFLNHLLEVNDYNVSKVVKAILEMK